VSHIHLLTDEQAGPQTQALFGKIHNAFKMVPNMFRALGHTPDILETTLSFDGAIQNDLDAKLRELAYLKTSKVNNCNY
jgi:alkylhydroperoxidase family enzyme